MTQEGLCDTKESSISLNKLRKAYVTQEGLCTCSFSMLLAPFLAAIVELIKDPDRYITTNVMP